MSNFISLLVSLILLGLTSAAVFRHDIHHKESLKTKLMKQGRWKEYAALQQRQLHGKFSNFKSTSQNINEFDDFEYYVNATIGTPGQLFTLYLYTMDGNVFIPDITCKDCPSKRKFNSSKSSTYQTTNYSIYNSSMLGFYGQDFVRFGNPGTDQLVIPNTMFGQIVMDIGSSLVDGTMGLGPVSYSAGVTDTPITAAIKSGILDSPVVTLFLRGVGKDSFSDKGGVITYGAIDTVNCDRNVVYEPLAIHDALTVTVKNAALGSSKFFGNWTAYIDTLSSFLFGPNSVVDAFAKELNATASSGIYLVDCSVNFNLNLTIGTTLYTLKPKELIMDNGNGTCTLKLSAINSNLWIFGYPWIETFCNILDYGNKRIGFANVINP